jgi:hypothetical protein
MLIQKLDTGAFQLITFESKPNFHTLVISTSLSIMSATVILSSAAIKTIQKSGKDIALKYATLTETWQRTYLATSEQDKFSAAMEKTDVPSNTATVILV